MSEILAPCGSPEVLEAALRAGADAVYLGGESFSARQNAVNFSDEELEAAVFSCHKRGVKVYRTINTLVFDEQMEELIRAVEHSARIGIDGLITQDLALYEIVRSCCPELAIHASTQMTVHTARGAALCREMGFSRVVVARELPLGTIRELCGLGVEIEVFVHGAQCMSVSGQCFMSAVIGSRSANRGLCAQACRLPCSAVRGREHYGLSLKDMSYFDSVRELEKAGVASLKIEGRMKRPEYAAMAVDCCRRALRGESYDRETLAGVFSRSGFTDGYLRGRLGREMFGVRSKEDAEAARQAFPKIHELYRRSEKRSTVTLGLRVSEGEPAMLTAEDENRVTALVVGAVPQPAKNRALTEESARERLCKSGDTIYEVGGVSCRIGEGLFLSPAELTSMRRKVLEELDKLRAEYFTRRAGFVRRLTEIEEAPRSRQTVRAAVSTLEQLRAAEEAGAELIAVPLKLAEEAARAADPERLEIRMPRFTFDEEAQARALERAKGAGISKVLATNLAHVEMAREAGMEVRGDFGLGAANSLALKALEELGVRDCVVSFELKAGQIRRLRRAIPIGVFSYGRLPLMLTVNCPIRCEVGCRECRRALYDRTGREMRVMCSKSEGYVEILNSEITDIGGRLSEFRGADFLAAYFTEESPAEVRGVIERLREDRKSEGRTNAGLYFRGVQ